MQLFCKPLSCLFGIKTRQSTFRLPLADDTYRENWPGSRTTMSILGCFLFAKFFAGDEYTANLWFATWDLLCTEVFSVHTYQSCVQPDKCSLYLYIARMQIICLDFVSILCVSRQKLHLYHMSIIELYPKNLYSLFWVSIAAHLYPNSEYSSFVQRSIFLTCCLGMT